MLPGTLTIHETPVAAAWHASTSTFAKGARTVLFSLDEPKKGANLKEAVMARRRRRRPHGGQTTEDCSGRLRAPFSTDTDSHTHTARSLACPLLTLSSSVSSFSNCIFRSDGAPCARPLLPSSDRSARQGNQFSHSTVLTRPVCLFVCVSDASFPCARPLLPSSARSAGQHNQPSHSTVLASPVCLFVCVDAASLPCSRPLLPSSDRSAGQRNQPSQSTVSEPCVPVCVC